MKILIVEDEIQNFLYLDAVLKLNDYETIHAEDGHIAIEIMKSRLDIALILMDIKMPEMNGYEATAKIREFNQNIPIIAQTAYAMVEDQDRIMESGFNDYLSKPILKDDLIRMIENYYKR